MAMIGSSDRRSRASRIVSSPSMSGMKMSVINKSGRLALDMLDAAAPIRIRDHGMSRRFQRQAGNAEDTGLVIDHDDFSHMRYSRGSSKETTSTIVA